MIPAAIGVVALLLSALGSLHDGHSFFQSYLFSFLYWSDLPVGALALLMIHHLTGGDWGTSLRPALRAISATLLLFAVLSLPILCGLKEIYPWTHAGSPHNTVYLTQIFFTARTLIYFGIWLVLERVLRTGRDDASLRRWSAGGLVLLGFTSTFASIDWQMSVEPSWSSTIYGMVYATGQALSALALALVVFSRTSLHADSASKKTLRDLGNLLLALLMTWAYLSFMQYLIIWSGNLPSEVTWYLHRNRNGWQWLAYALGFLQFAAPFILLLFRSSKASPKRLASVAGFILLLRVVDHYWMLIPGLRPDQLQLPWQAVTTWIGIGALGLSLLQTRLKHPEGGRP